MARYTGAKDRLSRREGVDLFGKGVKLTRLNIPPGMHGAKRVRTPSQYGRQLREKQKAKRIYGILERQFRKYVAQALKTRGNTGEKLISLLERRLDNVIYRLGFAPTRASARQLVTHRHVFVNGKRVNIPSYQTRVGESISLSSKAVAIPAIKRKLDEKNAKIPGWLEKKGAVGMVKSEPTVDETKEMISTQDIVEFYSR